MSDTLAAVDVGTNSLHLVVARTTDGDRFEVISREKEMVRLGSGSTDMKELADDAIDRAVDALARFRQIADSHGAPLRAVATSAVREADNRKVLLKRARKEADVDIEVVSGVEEARLIHLGVLQALELYDGLPSRLLLDREVVERPRFPERLGAERQRIGVEDIDAVLIEVGGEAKALDDLEMAVDAGRRAAFVARMLRRDLDRHLGAARDMRTDHGLVERRRQVVDIAHEEVLTAGCHECVEHAGVAKGVAEITVTGRVEHRPSARIERDPSLRRQAHRHAL